MTIILWNSEEYPKLTSLNTAQNNEYINKTANRLVGPLMGH